jgi:hypothetical protein
MGIAAAYIDDDWVFRVCHLSLKYISWTHKGKYLALPFANILTKSSLESKISVFSPLNCKHVKRLMFPFYYFNNYIIAQTTDSGSNNQTMTTEVDCLVCKKTGTNMNLKSNHIRCFCHKLALILNAGLKAIDVGTEGLTKDKQGTLGFVPKLALIAEEPNGKESLQTAASVHDIASDEEDGELPDHSSDESAAESVVNEDPPPALEPDVWSCSTISKVLKKVS